MGDEGETLQAMVQWPSCLAHTQERDSNAGKIPKVYIFVITQHKKNIFIWGNNFLSHVEHFSMSSTMNSGRHKADSGRLAQDQKIPGRVPVILDPPVPVILDPPHVHQCTSTARFIKGRLMCGLPVWFMYLYDPVGSFKIKKSRGITVPGVRFWPKLELLDV
jgi:hypothetical protein